MVRFAGKLAALLAIYDGKFPRDVYEGVPGEYSDYVNGVGLVCAAGQKCVTKTGLKLRTTQDYFRGILVNGALLAYPGRQLATLIDGIKDEPAVWMVGTGFAISRYEMLTAWHVVTDVLAEVDSTDAADLRVVTGYYRKSSASSKPTYRMLEVEKAERLMRGGQHVDVGKLTMKDPLDGGDVCDVLTNVNWPSDDDHVLVMGHPLGQPLKHTEGKLVDVDPHGDRSSAHARFSGFAGNSGSPVFWKGKLMGIFVAGDWPAEFAAQRTSDRWTYLSWGDGDGYNCDVIYIGDLID